MDAESDPIDSPSECKVIYPSCLFGLEKHELFPHERFAFTVLKIGVPALNAVNEHDSLTISFDDDPRWSPNVRVTAMPAKGGFSVKTSGLMPTMLFCLCHAVGKKLFDDEIASRWVSNPTGFRDEITSYGKALGNAIEVVRKRGLGFGIQTLIASSGVNIFKLAETSHVFDVAARFVANHEIAHAYVGQLTQKKRKLETSDLRGFEIVVDLVATNWLYQRIVKLTPDSDEYRTFRGTSTHSESIVANATTVLDGQIIFLLYICFASAMANGGWVSLKSSSSHPPYLARYLLQQIHFLTLVESNQSKHFAPGEADAIADHYKALLGLFISSGLIPADSLTPKLIVPKGDLATAARLIDEFNIKILFDVKALLQQQGSIQ
jgi:hypothetical protein